MGHAVAVIVAGMEVRTCEEDSTEVGREGGMIAVVEGSDVLDGEGLDVAEDVVGELVVVVGGVDDVVVVEVVGTCVGVTTTVAVAVKIQPPAAQA